LLTHSLVIGHGGTADTRAPKLVQALQGKRIVQLAAGMGHTAALAGACDPRSGVW
jgi:hypothetical protein